jgi:hypothetical protein
MRPTFNILRMLVSGRGDGGPSAEKLSVKLWQGNLGVKEQLDLLSHLSHSKRN